MLFALRWLRAQALAQLAVYFALSLVLGTGITAVVGGLMRALPGRPLLAWQIVAYVIGDVVVLAVLLLGLRLMERRTPSEAGLPRRHLVRDVLLGFAGGAAVMCAIVGVLAAAGWYRASPSWSAGGLVAALVLFLLAAVSEEIRFRAIAFRLIERALGTWIAAIGSALLFGLAHLGSPHATPTSALAVAIGGVAGALLFVLTRSVWPVIGAHWAWNFFEGTVFGVAVSGQPALPAVVRGALSGPPSWTGGEFGPEAGLAAVICAGAVSAALLVLALRRDRFVTPSWWTSGRPSPARPRRSP